MSRNVLLKQSGSDNSADSGNKMPVGANGMDINGAMELANKYVRTIYVKTVSIAF